MARLSVMRGGVGLFAIMLFGLMYYIEIDPNHEWPPPVIGYLMLRIGPIGLIAVNLLWVLGIALMLPVHRCSRKAWFANSLYVAFMFSVLTEMLGVPLILYILSPLVSLPSIGLWYFHELGHWFITLGVVCSFFGLFLTFAAWINLFTAVRSGNIACEGIYRFVRHPQYTGLLIFVTGWLLHWHTIVTLLLWPVMFVSYIRLAKLEEEWCLVEYGDRYREYTQSTGRFLPLMR